MGATSAFHEGGDHVAIRTGKIAGRLAARARLDAYNGKWQDAIGREVQRNVALAEMVRDWGPDDWDHAFSVADRMLRNGEYRSWRAFTAGVSGLKLLAEYEWRKFGFRNARYVQIHEDEYAV